MNQKLSYGGVKLSPVSERDFSSYCLIYGNPHTMRLVGKVMEPEELKGSFKQAIKDVNSSNFKQLLYSIFLPECSYAVGFVGIIRTHRHECHGEMGIMLMPKKTRKGTAKYAMLLFIRHLFATTNIDVVNSRHSVKNKAAYFAAKSVGFRFLPLPEKQQDAQQVRIGRLKSSHWAMEQFC